MERQIWFHKFINRISSVRSDSLNLLIEYRESDLTRGFLDSINARQKWRRLEYCKMCGVRYDAHRNTLKFAESDLTLAWYTIRITRQMWWPRSEMVLHLTHARPLCGLRASKLATMYSTVSCHYTISIYMWYYNTVL